MPRLADRFATIIYMPRAREQRRSRRIQPGAAIASLTLMAGVVFAAEPRTHDVLIDNAVIYDGSGGEPYRGEVAIDGDRIAYVGPSRALKERSEVDAHDRAVAPGFIHMMGHSEESLLIDGRAVSGLQQGVTLDIFDEQSKGPLTAEMARRSAAGDGRSATRPHRRRVARRAPCFRTWLRPRSPRIQLGQSEAGGAQCQRDQDLAVSAPDTPVVHASGDRSVIAYRCAVEIGYPIPDIHHRQPGVMTCLMAANGAKPTADLALRSSIGQCLFNRGASAAPVPQSAHAISSNPLPSGRSQGNWGFKMTFVPCRLRSDGRIQAGVPTVKKGAKSSLTLTSVKPRRN